MLLQNVVLKILLSDKIVIRYIFESYIILNKDFAVLQSFLNKTHNFCYATETWQRNLNWYKNLGRQNCLWL